jgi:hypothetical protein
MGSNGYMMYGGWDPSAQSEGSKHEAVSQSKSGNVWIYNIFCTGYIWSLLTCSAPMYTGTAPPNSGDTIFSVR